MCFHLQGSFFEAIGGSLKIICDAIEPWFMGIQHCAISLHVLWPEFFGYTINYTEPAQNRLVHGYAWRFAGDPLLIRISSIPQSFP